ncbi:MAG: hypothetical protein MUE30_13800 [Spirosomaceae bacterium]|nr:hypothetical protein [Spirosomataceae bacterium]
MDASELLCRLSGVVLSDKQIENLCHHYGGVLEDEVLDKQDVIVEKDADLTYAMVDGSYVMTRMEGWKEVKLGRVFKATDNYALSEKRNTIKTSHYVAHIGECTDFLEKFSPSIAHLTSLVCIADGAAWFWNWLRDYYPQAVQILDFYHGYEKICQWSLSRYKDKTQRDLLNSNFKELLLNDEIEEVIIQIQNTDCQDDSLDKKQTLLTYLENNKARMTYKTFLQKGYLIGSGAMESAHRNVIQQRMKRAGQRWTINGGQQVLNLRTKFLSNQWNDVTKYLKKAA